MKNTMRVFTYIEIYLLIAINYIAENMGISVETWTGRKSDA